MKCILFFKESQSKAEEGNTALMEAMKIEREESERAANLQHQIQVLRLKEREIADVRPLKYFLKSNTQCLLLVVFCYINCI